MSEGGADFVVHDLDINSVTALFEALHYDVVDGDAVLVVFCLEWLDQDCVAVVVVRKNDILVAASGAYWEAAHVIGV